MSSVILHTNLGAITLKLDTENTPETTENFLRYARENFYVDTVFHRVINGFMIQGGGLKSDLQKKNTHEPIKNEADKGRPNQRGTIAMARTSDPHSASSQFFINVADNTFLNYRSKTTEGWGYCAFGEVTEGMDVVDKITAVKTGSRAGHQDVPVEAIVIERVEVVE